MILLLYNVSKKHLTLYGIINVQATQQFYNKQINTTVLAFVYCYMFRVVLAFVYCYMFRPCWVIIRRSLHEYVTRYWVVYRYGSRSVIYKVLVRFTLQF
jgi:uncharacterized membrane protein YagU involved in acid resistance